ncbi:hypothetical protein AUK04_02910 [Candidatus Roizmanbacteria bacterium CG2_30_33_16]|uniref:HEPN domain-containing protein n=4 Tax=Candidatus Roizmaniibacteriota TaxID=1752723 RepID=A0A2H0C356_9BACT|nr:HEPN domain-containing protein [Candidatus Roizmanbacteria bacterium]OIP83947.1 MAG: hypothetical protein AUK04_02910 [Candidatus Roizmanbacteria bacterium CG2_30_33_16]PIP64342.1 MAG: hypothetical protein COW96_03070 [Candidatus Roizmanbacteria bacterium CG22_combo_CG10-13_8_21_14_all_33_16]PIX70324.1 MAG: hypothetical protein COZ39_04630 [Candidatus Roizmanbacteria bacterium CG_4_10_14_3_um_filter_33_21]PJB87875.1 MAG: hypothetical protein CO083_04700 [Candidatus Roizmanbacteria bacterium 
MKKETLVWFNQAKIHFSDAIFMYENRRYSGAVYFCHQALEKILKAAIVEKANKIPPKSHALEYLLKLSKLKPEQTEWSIALAEITRHFWQVRYGDYRQYKFTTRQKVEPTINFTKLIFLWVKKQLDNI